MPQMMKAVRHPIFSLFAASLLGLAGCAAVPSPSTAAPTVLPSGDNVGFAQRAYVDGPIIEPVKLLEDSRCPQNARCVWAGRLRVQMIWHRGNGEAMPFELTLGEPTHIADGHIEITAAPSAPILGEEPLKATDYRFSFHFHGGI